MREEGPYATAHGKKGKGQVTSQDEMPGSARPNRTPDTFLLQRTPLAFLPRVLVQQQSHPVRHLSVIPKATFSLTLTFKAH